MVNSFVNFIYNQDLNPGYFFASTYDSCSNCTGSCTDGCGGPNSSYPRVESGSCSTCSDVKCSNSCVYGTCTVACLVGPGCQFTCYSSCKTACYTYSACMALATVYFYKE